MTMAIHSEFARVKAEGVDLLYNYVPTLWICALFVALYSLSLALHLFQAVHYRLWFLIPTIGLAGVGEIIGWSGRLWSSKSPSLLDPFIIQITTIIIAPTPLVAANFVILGELINRLGQNFSRLNSMWYTLVFISCDIIALIIQAVGGAKASLAVENNKDPGPGGNIMLAGIAFQLASITIYMALAAEFILRYLYDRPVRNFKKLDHESTHYLDKKIKLMLIGLTLSSTVIFIRSVYRTIELSDGWSGRIISTQHLFNWLDGGMITLAFYTMNVFHPGYCLGSGSEWKHKRNTADSDTFVSGTTAPEKSVAKMDTHPVP